MSACQSWSVWSSHLFANGVLAEDLYDEEDDEDDLDGAEGHGEADDESHEQFEFRAHTTVEVKAAAQQLGDVVIEHGCRIADRYARLMI